MYQALSAALWEKLLRFMVCLRQKEREDLDAQDAREEPEEEPLDLAYTILALWSQYLSLGALLLYGVLRALLAPDVPLGAYSGWLSLLWPAAYLLLLASVIADRLLWRED